MVIIENELLPPSGVSCQPDGRYSTPIIDLEIELAVPRNVNRGPPWPRRINHMRMREVAFFRRHPVDWREIELRDSDEPVRRLTPNCISHLRARIEINHAIRQVRAAVVVGIQLTV